MFLASLLALFNAARGEGAISHAAWVIIAACLMVLNTPDLLHAGLWFYVTMIVTVQSTEPLLNGINGDINAMPDGMRRNLPIIPIMLIIPLAGIMLNQGTLYYLCGEWQDHRATRLAEYLTGFIIGLLILLPTTL